MSSQNKQLLLSVMFLAFFSGCGVKGAAEAMGEAVGNTLGNAIAEGIGNAIVPPTPIVSDSQSIEETGTGYNSIRILVSRDDFKLSVTTGDAFRVIVEAQAQTSAEIQNFVRASEKRVDNNDLIIEVGDKSDKCSRGYENEHLKAIHGVCINAITLVVPANFQTSIYVNEKPIDENREIAFDELLKGLDRLSFASPSESRKQNFVQSFLARAKNTRLITVSQLTDVLSKFTFEDDRFKIAGFFRKRVKDPQNAYAVGPAFHHGSSYRQKAIDALKE